MDKMDEMHRMDPLNKRKEQKKGVEVKYSIFKELIVGKQWEGFNF